MLSLCLVQQRTEGKVEVGTHVNCFRVTTKSEMLPNCTWYRMAQASAMAVVKATPHPRESLVFRSKVLFPSCVYHGMVQLTTPC